MLLVEIAKDIVGILPYEQFECDAHNEAREIHRNIELCDEYRMGLRHWPMYRILLEFILLTPCEFLLTEIKAIIAGMTMPLLMDDRIRGASRYGWRVTPHRNIETGCVLDVLCRRYRIRGCEPTEEEESVMKHTDSTKYKDFICDTRAVDFPNAFIYKGIYITEAFMDDEYLKQNTLRKAIIDTRYYRHLGCIAFKCLIFAAILSKVRITVSS